MSLHTVCWAWPCEYLYRPLLNCLVNTPSRSQRIVTYLIANRTLVNVAFFVSEYDREGEILPDSEHVTSGVDTSGFVQVSV